MASFRENRKVSSKMSVIDVKSPPECWVLVDRVCERRAYVIKDSDGYSLPVFSDWAIAQGFVSQNRLLEFTPKLMSWNDLVKKFHEAASEILLKREDLIASFNFER